MESLRNILRNILHIIKCHSGRFRAHLAVITEQVSFQTNEGCLCKLTMGLYGRPYNYVALIATLYVSLITTVDQENFAVKIICVNCENLIHEKIIMRR